MVEAYKTYVKTLPRHQRLIIFVDAKISEVSLRNIMEANLHIWGGRYNPIIPVQDNTIASGWIAIIKFFDPDFIYYSKSIDLEYLKKLNLFFPKEYIELRDGDQHHFPGVNIHCLLHEHVHNRFLTNQSVLLQYDGDWKMEVSAKPFYQLNFGFRQFYEGEKRWTNKLDTIAINTENAGEINKYICSRRPYFKSLLSSLHIDSIALDRNRSWAESRFEWVIYDPDKYLNDLLYFWNRQLFFEPKNKLMQVIVRVGEAEELLKDPWMGHLLQELSFDNQVSLVSQSISPDIMEGIEARMQAVCSSTRIEKKSLLSFPFKPGDVQYIKSNFFKSANNLILGKNDYLKFPDVAFENGEKIDNDPYAIDLVIEKETNDEHKEIKFPYETELHFIVCKAPSRINKMNRGTIFTNKDAQGTDFSMPSDFELIRSVLMHRKRNKELLTHPVSYINYSSAGQKLSAFFNLFDRDWSIIKQFLEEKFWLQLFRYASEVQKSAIPEGKGIFSYQDLIKEIDGLYSKYREDVRNYRREDPEQHVEEEELDRFIERCKKDAFEYHVNSELNYLIARSALFVGMKLKCRQCGSNKWYSLTELKDKLPCKGCNSEIIPNLESKIYYKLSDTIVNNLLSDQTRDAKEFDGNYVVLKTLLHLKEDHQNTGNSFVWTPCLDFSGQNGESVITSDLDIVVIQNGKLIIGEAKCKSSDFSLKVINSLIWVGNYLSPDQIIVSCRSGNLETVAEQIRSGLRNNRCKVIPYKVYPAWYHLPGIFGVGISKGKQPESNQPSGE